MITEKELEIRVEIMEATGRNKDDLHFGMEGNAPYRTTKWTWLRGKRREVKNGGRI